jgi:hypothetical protein
LPQQHGDEHGGRPERKQDTVLDDHAKYLPWTSPVCLAHQVVMGRLTSTGARGDPLGRASLRSLNLVRSTWPSAGGMLLA